jgi:hypothetical protein
MFSVAGEGAQEEGMDVTNKSEASSSHDPFPDRLVFWMLDRQTQIDKGRDSQSADHLASASGPEKEISVRTTT